MLTNSVHDCSVVAWSMYGHLPIGFCSFPTQASYCRRAEWWWHVTCCIKASLIDVPDSESAHAMRSWFCMMMLQILLSSYLSTIHLENVLNLLVPAAQKSYGSNPLWSTFLDIYSTGSTRVSPLLLNGTWRDVVIREDNLHHVRNFHPQLDISHILDIIRIIVQRKVHGRLNFCLEVCLE